MNNTPMVKRLALLGGPLALAALTLLHSHQDPRELGNSVTQWLAVHSFQLALSVLVAYCVWWMLEGIRGTAATVARAALPIFLVFFSATDAVAGLATGWLVHTANGQSGSDRTATLLAVDAIFNDNWLTGSFSVASSIGATAWAVVAVAAALALRKAGADGFTAALMALSALFLNHPPPSGTIGMLALCAAAYRWDRRRHTSTVDTPVQAESL